VVLLAREQFGAISVPVVRRFVRQDYRIRTREEPTPGANMKELLKNVAYVVISLLAIAAVGTLWATSGPHYMPLAHWLAVGVIIILVIAFCFVIAHHNTDHGARQSDHIDVDLDEGTGDNDH